MINLVNDEIVRFIPTKEKIIFLKLNEVFLFNNLWGLEHSKPLLLYNDKKEVGI